MLGSATNPFNLPPSFVPALAGDTGDSATQSSTRQQQQHNDAGRVHAQSCRCCGFYSHAPCSQTRAIAARRYIAAATTLLSTYRYILETHPVEFLTQRPMDRLPPAWLAELPELEDQLDLDVLLDKEPGGSTANADVSSKRKCTPL